MQRTTTSTGKEANLAKSMATHTPMAPGARIVVRDEEWLVRRVDPASDGGRLLTCDGVSDLVRGQSSLFLTALEGPIEVLDPAETQLVADPSPMFNAALLAIESQRRRTMPNDAKIHLGHRAVMDLEPYQLEPALQALRQPRSRILIADAVGLGKTLEAGILATELIQRGRGKRILVVTLKSMLTQFQKEWWSRFSIPLVRLDSLGLARVRNRIPSNHNPFNYFDRSIISIDTLKNNLEYRNYLENAWWDIIVIDECHNVAARATEQGKSRRARLAEKLAGRSDTLILLSATPHDGSARSFASLMALLDPTAISDPDDYTPGDYRDKGLVIRRFKKDIKHQVTGDFKERRTIRLTPQASPAEEAAYRALLAIRFTQGGVHRGGKQQELQRVAMQKAIFSSPFAALESTQTRIRLAHAGSVNPRPMNGRRWRISRRSQRRWSVSTPAISASTSGCWRTSTLPSAAGPCTTRRTAWWCSPSAWRPCAGCTRSASATCACVTRRSPSCTGNSPIPSSRTSSSASGARRTHCACCCVRTWHPRG